MTTEADVVRYVGVAVAVTGTIVTAPGGTALIAGSASRSVHSGVRRLRYALQRIPILRRWALHSVSKEMRFGWETAKADDSASASVSAWAPRDPAGTTEEQLRLMDERTQRLLEELKALRVQTHQRLQDLNSRLGALAQELRSNIDALSGRLDNQEREAARIDARGLPLIGLGILLTGLPEELSRYAAVGWASITVAVGFTAWVLLRVRKQRATAT